MHSPPISQINKKIIYILYKMYTSISSHSFINSMYTDEFRVMCRPVMGIAAGRNRGQNSGMLKVCHIKLERKFAINQWQS